MQTPPMPYAPRYRVGTTSFIHPAGWLENARRLAGRVGDVELLFFEPDGPGGLPEPAEIAGLGELARGADLTYTVHGPLRSPLASADAGRRRAAVDRVRRTIERTLPLDPRAVVIHLYPGEEEGIPSDSASWPDRAEESIRSILATGLPRERLCVESLDGRFGEVEPLLEALGLSAALDVGHLARDGIPFDGLLARQLARAGVVQWHGTDPSGRDHRSLAHYPRADALRLLGTLAREGWDGVLTLEVFSEADLEESLAVLAGLERERDRQLPCEGEARP